MSTEHRRAVTKTTEVDDVRRRREDDMATIRKQKREDVLQKRRNIRLPTPEPNSAFPNSTANASDSAMTDGSQPNNQFAELPGAIAVVMSPEPTAEALLSAVCALRKLLSLEDNPPIEDVIRAGAVPRLVALLACDSLPQLQFEAAWSLTNVASGTPEQTQAVVAAGAVEPLTRLLSSDREDVREQCVWALGNIAGDSAQLRDYATSHGALQPLLQLVTASLAAGVKQSLLRNACWALSNFCRGKPAPSIEVARLVLPVLAQLVYHPDPEVVTDACWALSYISDGSNKERIGALIESGLTRHIVELMSHPHTSVQTPALRTIGNIATGNDEQTQTAINVGALPALLAMMSSPKKSIRKEACWTVSNITAGTRKQIQAVLDAGLVGPLLHMMDASEFEVRKEAAWAISNACSGGSLEQVRFLAMQGCVAPLCGLLSSNDAKIVVVALEGLENILEVGERDSRDGTNQYANEVEEAEGLGKIELLQTHRNSDIYEKASRILEMYFNGEEDDGSLVPRMDETDDIADPSPSPAVAPQQQPLGMATYSFGLPPQQVGGGTYPQQPFSF